MAIVIAISNIGKNNTFSDQNCALTLPSSVLLPAFLRITTIHPRADLMMIIPTFTYPQYLQHHATNYSFITLLHYHTHTSFTICIYQKFVIPHILSPAININLSCMLISHFLYPMTCYAYTEKRGSV